MQALSCFLPNRIFKVYYYQVYLEHSRLLIESGNKPSQWQLNREAHIEFSIISGPSEVESWVGPGSQPALKLQQGKHLVIFNLLNKVYI